MVTGFTAILYDGRSSAPQPVAVSVDAVGTVSIAQRPEFSAKFTDLEIQPRVGNTARHVRLPGGLFLESKDNDAIDSLVEQWRPARESLAHRLEANLKLVFASILILVALGYGFVAYGIPLLSGVITAQLPLTVDEQMADKALEQMDRLVFQASKLSAQRRQELQALFEGLRPADGRHYQLYFRSSARIGANAFALPDGTIVMTDQLVRMATNDQMLASVMLHEIGHVRHRHAVQGAVRQAGVAAVILLFTGDIGTASSLVLVLPSLLLQAGYSQEFEWQSDTYALEQMSARGMDTNAFADMMEKMMGQAGEKAGKDAEKSRDLMSYFSSHPPSAERVRRFREAAAQPPQPSLQ